MARDPAEVGCAISILRDGAGCNRPPKGRPHAGASMPKLILIGGILDLGFMKAPLLAADPRLDITVWPEDDGAEADIAVCWRPPAGLLGTMPKLKLVQSIAAGVDGVLNDAGLDPALPVARI